MQEENIGFVRIPNAEVVSEEGQPAKEPTLTWPVDPVTQAVLNRLIDDRIASSGGSGGGSGSGNWYGYLNTTGGLTTTTDEPVSKLLFPVTSGKGGLLSLAISADDVGDILHASFLKNVLVKNNAGVLSFYDQIQDVFTMRDDDWDADVSFEGNSVFIRCIGKTAQTVVWRYSASFIPI